MAFHRLRNFILLSALAAVPVQVVGADKAFTAELMVQNESVGDVRFSADGSRLYFDRLLPYREKQHIDQEQNRDRDLSSLSIADVASGRIEQLSRAAEDRTWYLSESPDGRYLAYGWLDDGVARLALRDLRSGEENRLQLPLTMNVGCAVRCPMWVSDHELLVLSQDRDEQARSISPGGYALRKLLQLSEQAWTGRETSARVTGSGRYQATDAGDRPLTLHRVDARTGEAREIEVLNMAWFTPLLAPGGRRMVFLDRKGDFDLAGLREMDTTWMDDRSDLVVYDIGTGRKVVPVCEGCTADYGSLRWSPSGRQLYFSARSRAGDDIRRQHFVYDTASGSVAPVRFEGVEVRFHQEFGYAAQFAPVLWVDEEHLAVRTRNEQAGQFEDQQFRWFLVDRRGKALRELTAGLARGEDKKAFESPVGVYRGSLLVAGGGHLWRLPVQGASARLAEQLGEVDSWCPTVSVYKHPPRCYAFLARWMDMPLDEAGLKRGRIAVLPKRNGVRTGDVAFVDLETGKVELMRRPDAQSEPLQASAATGAAVYWRKSDDRGDELLLVRADGSTQSLHRFNQHLAGVKKATPVMLTRREPGETEDRYDWVLLPPDHKPGQRHPLLVWFYPDEQYGKQLRQDDLRNVSFVNLNIPTARGYAVLLASMKISDFGTPGGNPMREMHEQLIRAAENVVAQGYADAERWALMGHSYGGYGTNSIVTQTNRFKAAISSAGMSNLTNNYGDWGVWAVNYVPGGFDYAAWHEHGQGRMGVPPWQDPQRYIDNSPLFSAHRIETPLLMFDGDLDYPDQAEQLMTAMHRQGKDAIFVRYWGEGHVYQSPPNIVDMWQRIFAFLDEHLGPPQGAGGR